MRFTLDYDKKFGATLDSLAALDGRTKAEVIRRAVASYSYLKKETRTGSFSVALVGKDGAVKKEVVLP